LWIEKTKITISLGNYLIKLTVALMTDLIFEGPVSPADEAKIRETFERFMSAIEDGRIDPPNTPRSVTVITDFDFFRQEYPNSNGAVPSDPSRQDDAFDDTGRPNNGYFGFRPGENNVNPTIFMNTENSLYATDPDSYNLEGSFAHELLHTLWPGLSVTGIDGTRTGAGIGRHSLDFYDILARWSAIAGVLSSKQDLRPLENEIIEDILNGLNEQNLCFDGATLVTMHDQTMKPISDLCSGDTILSFDPLDELGRGALVPRRVTRLYRNMTTEWIKLTWIEDSEHKELVATPGHHFLDRFGAFPTIQQMLQEGCATVVLASGALAEVMAERVVYSAETAHMFERAVAAGVSVGNVALQPVALDAWQSYNFEVEDLHTYVAGGVRVHNMSGPQPDFSGRLIVPGEGSGASGSGNARREPPDGSGRGNDDSGGRSQSGSQHESAHGNSGQTGGNSPSGNSGHGPGGNTSHNNGNGPGGNTGPNSGIGPGGNRTAGDQHDGIGGNPGSRPGQHGNPAGGFGSGTSIGNNQNKPSGGPQNTNHHNTDKKSNPGNYDKNGDPGFAMSPILLDLDGDGIQITDASKSTQFVDAGGDGLLHRSAWAAAGNGVLFFDAGGDGQITEKREYVFTEWDPTAEDDLAALRAVFDSNGDGKLTVADAAFGQFKVLVTNADGSTTAQTLAQLGITEINLTADATRIVLPDGSVITGQTTFTRANGTTGTVANTTLIAEADGHRVVQVTSTDAGGNRLVVSTAYQADGSVAYAIRSVTTPTGASTTNTYDDNGDGVTDRIQTIVKVTNPDGSRTETVINKMGADAATAVLDDRTVTVTSADNKVITINRDTNGGGWFDEREVRTTHADGSRTQVISELAQNGTVIRSTSETMSVNGLARSEGVDADGNGTTDLTTAHVIAVAGDNSRTEVVTEINGDGSMRSSMTETINANGRVHVEAYDLDGDGDTDRVDETAIVVNADGSTASTIIVKNGDGSIRTSSTETQDDDALSYWWNYTATDFDGDGDLIFTMFAPRMLLPIPAG
jgi:hypothetical protein